MATKSPFDYVLRSRSGRKSVFGGKSLRNRSGRPKIAHDLVRDRRLLGGKVRIYLPGALHHVLIPNKTSGHWWSSKETVVNAKYDSSRMRPNTLGNRILAERRKKTFGYFSDTLVLINAASASIGTETRGFANFRREVVAALENPYIVVHARNSRAKRNCIASSWFLRRPLSWPVLDRSRIP
jgi:hypothetical protein